MGWRNYFIKLNFNDSEKKGVDMEQVEKFVDHHNNYHEYLSVEELKEINIYNTYPGEELSLNVIVREVGDKKEYWGYLGNNGGSSYTQEWAEKYFPNLDILDSGSFPYYDDNWVKWPYIKLEDFKRMKKN